MAESVPATASASGPLIGRPVGVLFVLLALAAVAGAFALWIGFADAVFLARVVAALAACF